MNNRIDFIDVAKVIGIFFIVLGHMPMTNRPFLDWIFSFHVPLFFFLSGYLHKVCKTDVGYLKKTAYLMLIVTIPYFIINRIWGICQTYLFYRSDFTIDNLVYSPLKYYLTGQSHIGPIWFLFSLFWMKLFYNLLTERMNTRLILMLSVIASIVYYYLGATFNYYQIGSFILTFPLYALGGLLRQLSQWDKLVKSPLYLKAVICLLSFVLLFVIIREFLSINIYNLDVGTNIFTMFLMSITGILFICTLSMIIPSNKIIVVLSNGTMVILGLHMILIQVCKIIYKTLKHITLPPPPYMDTMSAVLFSVIILVLLYPVIKIFLNSKYKYVRLLACKM